MKLFITNKRDFEAQLDCEDRFVNTNRDPLNTNQIHKKAFSQLFKSITEDGNIPVIIFERYDSGEGVCLFNFVNKKDDIYFYEYTGTAS